MQYLLFIFGLIMLTSFFACTTFRFKNGTECELDAQEIKKALRNYGIKAEDITIYSPSIYGEVNHECVGLYSITVNKWKGVKTNLNSVGVPVLIIDNRIYINNYFVNGRIKNSENIKVATAEVEKILSLFAEENGNLFEIRELMKINDTFKYGIEIFPKGRLRN